MSDDYTEVGPLPHPPVTKCAKVISVAMNRGWSYREQIGPDGAGRTVLAFLSATHPHSSTLEWAARVDRGEVEVGGASVEGDAILHAGQMLVWNRPPWDEAAVPEDFEIIHQDDAIVVVNKPSGLPTMPAGGFLDHTLLAKMRQRYPEASPLHRLGRHTSGLVVFARTREATSALARAWRERDVKKRYRALCAGAASTPMLEIDAPIGPVPHPRLGTVQAACADGKPSHSVATVLEERGDQTLFSVEIATGRPHQIRIHMAYAGHPLVGDPLYAAGGGLKSDPGLPGDGGYQLHAERLQFLHPISGDAMTVTATPPPTLEVHSNLVRLNDRLL